MKHRILAFAICLPLAGGCTTAATVAQAANGTATQAAPAAMLAAKKGLIAAHSLHEAAADALTAAANTNLCKGSCAVTARGYLDQSEAALKAADGLVALGDAAGIEAKISGATALIARVQSLVSGSR